MKKKLTLEAQLREGTGTRLAKNVRKQGNIPAVIYGHKQDAVSVVVSRHAFTEGLHHGHRLMDIKMGSKKESVMVKDLQYDYLGKDIIHADLVRVSASERVKVNVPIELKGTAAGTHEGGIVEEHVDSLEIECVVSQIPETIIVHVADVGVGDNLHASDIELPEGVKLITSEETLVVTCHLVAAAISTEELEEEIPTAPEVIGEVKEEDSSEEGE